MGADTAGLLGVPALASHQSATREGRCQKQTGPALFAPGNSRAAYSPPQAAWLTPLVPARPPTASAWHRPSTPFQASLVQANRSGQFSGERRGIFSKGHCAHRAQFPLAPSLFVFFFFTITVVNAIAVTEDPGCPYLRASLFCELERSFARTTDTPHADEEQRAKTKKQHILALAAFMGA
jgi:hypothetical protein